MSTKEVNTGQDTAPSQLNASAGRGPFYVVNAGVYEDYAGWGQIWFVGVFSSLEKAEDAVAEAERHEGVEAWVEGAAMLDEVYDDEEA